MLTLAIDCATEACSVALFDDVALLAGERRPLGRGHAEALVPMIAALPGRGEAQRIAVAMGPGSFTGVRVGLAAARALAFAWAAELVGYSSLALIAAMARDEAGDVEVGVATTGGHGEWFVQRFAADGAPLGSVASLTPEAAVSALVDCSVVAGSQAEAVVAARGHGRALALWPDARSANLLSPAAFTSDVQPLYGRGPDARLPGGIKP